KLTIIFAGAISCGRSDPVGFIDRPAIIVRQGTQSSDRAAPRHSLHPLRQGDIEDVRCTTAVHVERSYGKGDRFRPEIAGEMKDMAYLPILDEIRQKIDIQNVSGD